MDRRIYLTRSINEELIARKLCHAQLHMLVVTAEGRRRMAIKFINLDLPGLKDRVKELADNYHESLVFWSETKTTMTYLI